MKKAKAIETINELPADFDLDILIEKLIFIDKVKKGLDQLQNRNTFTHQQVKQKVGDRIV